jgi:cytoplasmic iron level regulating protein YaaA (DUF328/UPF0246 family)
MAMPANMPVITFSQPIFKSQTEYIIQHLLRWSEKEIITKMGVSVAIAKETMSMHQAIQFPMQTSHASPAILTFTGDVYRGLDAKTLSEEQLIAADDKLRILSGMYGYLKPLHLIQPYRLMMATPLKLSEECKSLASYWRPLILQAINEEIKEDDVLVNLASQEYSAALEEDSICSSIVRCDFREIKNGKAVSISTFAKVARGMMARYIILQSPKNLTELKKFNTGGYRYNKELSDEKTLMFTR